MAIWTIALLCAVERVFRGSFLSCKGEKAIKWKKFKPCKLRSTS